MTVDDKIRESEFFLQKIIDNYEKFPEMEYYFHAFVVSTRSIPDYLLEEYNQRFGLNISEEERDFRSIFTKKANDKGGDAKKFDKWYDQQISAINSDPTGRELWARRNLVIHRKSGQIMNLAAMAFGGEDHRDKFVNFFKIFGIKATLIKSTSIWVQGLGFTDPKDSCEKFLSLMKNMVSNSRIEFP